MNVVKIADGSEPEDSRRLEWLDPGDICLTDGTQPRTMPIPDLQREYAEAMKAGDIFPPVNIVTNGKKYWPVDGYHRIVAAKLAGMKVYCELIEGSLRDAILLSVGSNAENGQRRSNDDKRRSVLRLLNDLEWGQWSNAEIARRCKVSETLVSNLRYESTNPAALSSFRKVKRNGVESVVRTTAKIPEPIEAREIPEPTPAQQKTTSSAYHSVLRSLRARSDSEVEAHYKTERLQVAVIKTRDSVIVVEAVLTVAAFKEAFATVLLARQEIGTNYKAVIIGRRTDEVAEWIKLARECGVEFQELS